MSEIKSGTETPTVNAQVTELSSSGFKGWMKDAFYTFLDMDVFNPGETSVLDELTQWSEVMMGMLGIPAPQVKMNNWNVYATAAYHMYGSKIDDSATIVGASGQVTEGYWNFNVGKMGSSGLGAALTSQQNQDPSQFINIQFNNQGSFNGFNHDTCQLAIWDWEKDGYLSNGVSQVIDVWYKYKWSDENKSYDDDLQAKIFVYIYFKPNTNEPYKMDIYVQELHENKGDRTPLIQMADIFVGIQRKEEKHFTNVTYKTESKTIDGAYNWSEVKCSTQQVMGINEDNVEDSFQNWAKLRVRKQLGNPSDLENKTVSEMKDDYISHKFGMYCLFTGEIPYNHDGSAEFNAHVDISAQLGLFSYNVEGVIDWEPPTGAGGMPIA